MMNYRLCALVFLLCLVSFFATDVTAVKEKGNGDTAGGIGWGSSREEILANRNRRKYQLQGLMNSMRKSLADHSAGEITLDPKEKSDMERRLDLYARKLKMLDRQLEDKDFERIIERTNSQNERRDRVREQVFSDTTADESSGNEL